MIRYLLILLLVACNSKKKENSGSPYSVLNEKDTVVGQKVEFTDQYILYTWVRTDKRQDAFIQMHYFYAPIYFYSYSNIIKGSFDYIKKNKQAELLRAEAYIDTLKLIARNAKLINDSLEMLMQPIQVRYVLDNNTTNYNYTGVFTNVQPGQHVMVVNKSAYTFTVDQTSDLKVLLNIADSTKFYIIINKK